MSAFFENSPVTFGVFLMTLFFSFFYGETEYLKLDSKRIFSGEIWRFIFGHLAFTNMAQTVVGLLLLYTYRSFERQMGSRKYGAFLFLSWLYCNAVYLILLAITRSVNSSFSPSSGPFFFIFAQLAFFYKYIPKVYQNQYVFAGISFSEKSGIYLLSAQLFFSDGLESIIAGLIAITFGFLYTQNIARIQVFRLPIFIENFFVTISSALSTLLPRTQPGVNRAARPAIGTARDRRPNQFTAESDFFGNVPEPQTFEALPQPDEESVNTLMALGFERNAVVQALRASGNNVDAAANRLLR